MQLLMSPLSPYARKVRVLIREAGQGSEITETAVSTTMFATAPEILAANPTGRIPVLVRDDGEALFDSRVITRYLDDLWSVGLYPAAGLWEVLRREAAAEGIIDSSLAMSYEMRLRPADKVWDDWLDAHWAKIARMLDALEAGEPEGPIDMARIALACALGHVDFRHGARNWRGGRPKLAAWYDAFAERPSMVATQPA